MLFKIESRCGSIFFRLLIIKKNIKNPLSFVALWAAVP